MEKNRVLTYSLLAFINNQSGIEDFSEIFIPLTKRTLSKINCRGISKGLLEDVKKEMDLLYSLDMPYPLLKKNLEKIASSYNSETVKDFQVFRDGSFILHKYLFLDYEEVISQQEADVEAVQLAYEKYLEANGFKINEQASIFDFLNQHSLLLSNFFVNKDSVFQNESYLVQANFINEIKGVKEIFEILKKIYLGSIISSYLEADFGKDCNNKLDFILDTTFIVSLLELHSAEANHTCNKILEICKRLGYGIFVLNDTIEETQSLLFRSANNINKNFFSQKVDTNGIYNACERLCLTKTDLERISVNLEKTLSDKGITLISNTISYRNKAKYSKVYETLKERKSNPQGALHDATAIIYVKEKRGKSITTFYDAKCWFVTDMRNDVYQEESKRNKVLPESMRADELVNILWLSNPNVKTTDVTAIGLSRLVATTINDSLPSPRLLRELDDNIQKYAVGKIDASECVRVASMVANRTLVNLDQLNKVAQKNPNEFIFQLKELAAKSKIEEKNKEKRTNKLVEKIHEDFEKRFLDRDAETKIKHQEELDHLEKTLLTSTQEKIDEKEGTTQNLKNQLTFTQYELLKTQITTFDNTKDLIEKKANVFALKCTLFLTLVLSISYCVLMYLLFIKINHNLTEVYLAIVFSPPFILIGNFFLSMFINSKVKIDPFKLKQRLIIWKRKKLYDKYKFDTNQYLMIQKQLKEIEETGNITILNYLSQPNQLLSLQTLGKRNK